MKLTTAKQAVGVLSEALESFGGAGYVEDTGLPRMLRDAQVLPIWEGTTNVLSLDALRAIAKEQSLDVLEAEVRGLAEQARDPRLAAVARLATDTLDHARRWLDETSPQGALDVEAGARRFAMTLGRSLSLALLVRHAQWSVDHERDARSLVAALRYAARGVDLLRGHDREEAAALANDTPLDPDRAVTSRP